MTLLKPIPFSVLLFETSATPECGEIKTILQNQMTPIGPLDMQIAGHAKTEKMILVTNNVKEFEYIPALKSE